MSYAYGMKSGPAVGNGLPGLPRRGEALERRPSSIDLSRYYAVATYSSGVNGRLRVRNLGTGETVEIIPPRMGTTNSSGRFSDLNVSEDGKYLILCTGSNSSYGSPRIYLYSLPDGTMLSEVSAPFGTATGSNGRKSVAINSEKGLIAISASTGTAYHLIFTIEEFLKGGSYQDLEYTTIPQSPGINSSGTTYGLEINRQGNLLLFSSTIGRTQLIDIESKSSIFIQREDGSNSSSGSFYFSPDGRMFCVNFTSGPETRLFLVDYDSSGKYLSHTPVFTYEREGSPAVVSNLEGNVIFPYMERTGTGHFGLEHKVRLYDPYTGELISEAPSNFGTYSDDSAYHISWDGYVYGLLTNRNLELAIPPYLSKDYSPEQNLIKRISLAGLGNVNYPTENLKIYGPYYG